MGTVKRFYHSIDPMEVIPVYQLPCHKSPAELCAIKTAYIKGRYIGESVRLISDILDYTDNSGIEAILFVADFEKALDSIDHTFLFSALKSYGFGPDFIQWVKTLFNNAESSVMNNGQLTGYFPLKRGMRQGDPLSAYLSSYLL